MIALPRLCDSPFVLQQCVTLEQNDCHWSLVRLMKLRCTADIEAMQQNNNVEQMRITTSLQHRQRVLSFPSDRSPSCSEMPSRSEAPLCLPRCSRQDRSRHLDFCKKTLKSIVKAATSDSIVLHSHTRRLASSHTNTFNMRSA